jgi:flap endonuclease-1
MGVKLQNIITREEISFSTLSGSIIVIDAPNIIMGLFNFARKNPDGSPAGLLLDHTQRPIGHLYGLLYRINYFYSKNIFPLFVFDGRVSELKRIITKDQLKDFLFMQKWYHSAMNEGRLAFAKSIAASRDYQWQNIISESKTLLSALGVPYFEAPASAESQCAQLVKNNIVHYSNSQDFDSLVFGCPFLIQNLSKSLRRKVQNKWVYQKIMPLRINLKKNLEHLVINQFQLVDMAILIGCDYFQGIRKIGPKTALKLIKKYHSIERIISHESYKYDFSALNPDLIGQVRKLFLFPDVLKKYPDLVWSIPNESKVMAILCEQRFLEKKRVFNNLEQLIHHFEQSKHYYIHEKDKSQTIQQSLDQFFSS